MLNYSSLTFPSLPSPSLCMYAPFTYLTSPSSSLVHVDDVELSSVNGTGVDVLRGGK